MQQLDNVLWAISIHALREEGDMPILRACLVRCLFLSTPSARRATRDEKCREYKEHISIHALREEGDASAPVRAGCAEDFYPRPPRGGRPIPKAGR